MEDDTAWRCIKCKKSIFPFNGIGNNELHSTGQKIKFMTFSKKTNSNKQILTERFNDMITKKNLITLQLIMTIKNSIKTLTKTFIMAQIFYI